MTYTVDTSAQTVTIQGDTTFDELKELGEKFAGYTVKTSSLTLQPWHPDIEPIKPYYITTVPCETSC